jgi:hypothetical protein
MPSDFVVEEALFIRHSQPLGIGKATSPGPLRLPLHAAEPVAHAVQTPRPRAAAGILESHRRQVLGAEQRAMADDARPLRACREGHGAGAIGEDRVGHRALEAVGEYDVRFRPLRKNLQDVVAKYEDNAEFYDYVTKIMDNKGGLDEVTQRLVMSVLGDKTLAKTFAWVEELDKELRALAAADKAWQTTAIAGEVNDETTQNGVKRFQEQHPEWRDRLFFSAGYVRGANAPGMPNKSRTKPKATDLVVSYWKALAMFVKSQPQTAQADGQQLLPDIFEIFDAENKPHHLQLLSVAIAFQRIETVVGYLIEEMVINERGDGIEEGVQLTRKIWRGRGAVDPVARRRERSRRAIDHRHARQRPLARPSWANTRETITLVRQTMPHGAAAVGANLQFFC